MTADQRYYVRVIATSDGWAVTLVAPNGLTIMEGMTYGRAHHARRAANTLASGLGLWAEDTTR